MDRNAHQSPQVTFVAAMTEYVTSENGTQCTFDDGYGQLRMYFRDSSFQNFPVFGLSNDILSRR